MNTLNAITKCILLCSICAQNTWWYIFQTFPSHCRRVWIWNGAGVGSYVVDVEWMLYAVEFSMFHRIIIISFSTHIYNSCNFIHMLWLIRASQHRNHIRRIISYGNDAFVTRECSHFTHGYQHVEGYKWCFLFDTMDEGNSKDNSILGKIHIESWRHGIFSQKKTVTWEFFWQSLYKSYRRWRDEECGIWCCFFSLHGVVLNDIWCFVE